jgi:formimidoylglutamate deiminase
MTIDLNDLSVAGGSPDALLPAIVFGMQRGAVKDVAVGGRMILRDGRHEMEEEIVERYQRVSARVWD